MQSVAILLAALCLVAATLAQKSVVGYVYPRVVARRRVLVGYGGYGYGGYDRVAGYGYGYGYGRGLVRRGYYGKSSYY